MVWWGSLGREIAMAVEHPGDADGGSARRRRGEVTVGRVRRAVYRLAQQMGEPGDVELVREAAGRWVDLVESAAADGVGVPAGVDLSALRVARAGLSADAATYTADELEVFAVADAVLAAPVVWWCEEDRMAFDDDSTCAVSHPERGCGWVALVPVVSDVA